ncbi:HAD family hydrolase [Sporolactobacillus putidus]|uniref:Haloacid dehalogenase n=1 Tax=Sporolactobacillus putidus TaxID=492735 RepID=A0A917S473_9BACL|nr:HAD hydrolase-like protein [Sporolactobacillus putidus]GGL53503.1 haloacid dehalogenase [Sporolactobacillus putidus]
MIKTVLFDVDGVFLSEERYFDASALTVWEILMSANYLGLSGEKTFRTAYSDEEIAEIRTKVFENDDVLNFMKSRGMNANWDMIYMTLSEQLIHMTAQLPDEIRHEAGALLQKPIDRETLGTFKEWFKIHPVEPDFERFLTDFSGTKATKQGLILYLNEIAEKRLGIKTDVFKPKSTFWHIGEHASQEWYVGDENILTSTGEPSVQPGKKGFLNEEVTLAEPNFIREMFLKFNDNGLSVGIATGRPRLETYKPFGYLHWLETLDDNHIVTADDVLAAEKKYDAAPLAKPHPFTYLLSFHGKDSEVRRWTAREPEKLPNGSETLIVGDSLADLLAAKQLGCRFAGVLTGLSGGKARGELEAHGADYILDSVAEVKDLVLGLREK